MNEQLNYTKRTENTALLNCRNPYPSGFLALLILLVFTILPGICSGLGSRIDSISLTEDGKDIYINIRVEPSISNFKANLLTGNVYVVDIENTVIPESEIKYVNREPLEFIKVWQFDPSGKVARLMLKLTREADVNLRVGEGGRDLKIAVSKEIVSTIYSSRDGNKTVGSNNSDPADFRTLQGGSVFDLAQGVVGQTASGVAHPGTVSSLPGGPVAPGSASGKTISALGAAELAKSDQKKVTFKFTEYELYNVLEFMSDILGATILIDSSIKVDMRQKKISVYVKDLGVTDALKLVLETNGLSYRKFNDNTYIVMTDEKFEEEKRRVEKIYRLTNAKPDYVIQVLAKSKSLNARMNIQNISADDRSNSLVVYETPETIAMLDKLIPKLDRKEKQVQIDMKLVEVSRKAGEQMGIRFDDTFTITNVADFPSRIPVAATLSALLNNNKAKVLASPKIRALHDKAASIKIGETIPVPYYELVNSTSNQSGSNQSGIGQNNIGQINNTNNNNISANGGVITESSGFAAVRNYKDIDVGIILDVKPFIHSDNEITLDLKIEVSSVVDITQEGQVHKEKRETKSYVRIDDGETAVIGGIIKDNERNRVVKVPFLGEIPGLGRLFQHHITDMESSEMVMFITPHLVNLDPED
ncbi:MAG: hypothetical protein CVV64_17005 [Candidatus Wallbacteria bacterium HGW-Wallbacteria-1]|jgi:type II secretory pathway component GspD/PulD (secretin)|uniref:Secretin/TonB short N-terminal domain-containing protein n=1 Tax=Candidatus Wallbacteria bacterium HGW-Wallbacteria-1 TaxID=2013854 RepID=A0A2N1PKN3_9BACT|nr:MAG: hypothetical protein CVV64_17005 [Candidatus Wallbacteria bacterium HGW-Wallbacteria-1]